MQETVDGIVFFIFSISSCLANKECLIGISNSPQIFKLVFCKASKVELTAPSVEFSSGTIPYELSSLIASKTSGIVLQAVELTELPKFFLHANSE